MDLKTLTLIAVCMMALNGCERDSGSNSTEKLYIYTYNQTTPKNIYDEGIAVTTIQGIVNRDSPVLYIRSKTYRRPDFWLRKFYGAWIGRPEKVEIDDLENLIKWAGDRVKGIIIWDENVPASVNVATTMAGVMDAVVMPEGLANYYSKKYGYEVLYDLRGKFTGERTGSAKNDAYLWAKENYLDKGLCSKNLLCLYEDSARARNAGDLSYVTTRDLAVSKKAFVFDLSPWGDEAPADDPDQKVGTDLNTYKLILASQMKQNQGKQMTELSGFFSFWKYSDTSGVTSKHGDVETEWETVYVISEYNCYQNTVVAGCFNQSFHCLAPLLERTQGRPETYIRPRDGKTYICLFMADYDSALPLYDFIPDNWSDPRRGEHPLLWGINPNLCETFPDIMQWLYVSRAPDDYFASDASCAGYFNPNRIKSEYLPLFAEHNKKYFEMWDMSLAPMVLDTDQPTDAVKDAFVQFAPDGFSEIVIDFHKTGGHEPQTHLWKGMPVTQLHNGFCHEGANFTTPKEEAVYFASRLAARTTAPQFYIVRLVWISPSEAFDVIDEVKKLRPDLNIELLDGYNFFNCIKITQQKQ